MPPRPLHEAVAAAVARRQHLPSRSSVVGLFACRRSSRRRHACRSSPNDGFCVFSGVLHFAVQDNFCRPRHWPSSLTMFYTQQLLARKGPLGLWWLLGNGRPLSGVQCRCSTAELQHIAGMRQSMPISHARTRSGDECNRQHARCMPCAAECRRIRLMSKAIPEAVEELINPQYVERLTAKRPLPRTCIELRPITRAIATGCRSRYACSRSSRAGSCAI